MPRSRWGVIVWGGLAWSFLAGSLSAQQFSIQLSGDSGVNLLGGNGAPMVLAPVPGWMPTSPEQLISQARVEQDLELVDWQRQELKTVIAQVREASRKKRQDINQRLKTEMDPLKREALQGDLAKIDQDLKQELKEKMEGILLPFQRDRLTQIVAQTKINNRGAAALQSEEFAQLLDLSEAQRKELEEKQQAMQKKLQEEIQELRRKRQMEVIADVLKPSQLKKLRSVMGEDLAKLRPQKTETKD